MKAVLDQLSHFIADAPVSMAVFDRDMRYVAWSDAWVEYYGLDPDTLSGRSHYDAFPDVPASWRDAHARALAGEVMRCEEDRFTRADGSVSWCRWVIMPITDAQGDNAGIAMFTEDISERIIAERRLRASEERLRLTTEAAELGLFDANLRTGTTMASAQFLRMLGLPTDCTTPGFKQLTALLEPSERRAFLRVCAKALKSSGTGRISLEIHPVINGERQWLQFTGQVLFDATGRSRVPIRLIGMLISHTESRRLQEALSSAQRLETVGRMAGVVAHDFNNLLTVILSNLELADLRTADTAMRAHIRHAMEAAEMGANFNKRLLALAGGRQTTPLPVRLDAHIASTWDVFERVLGEGMTIRFAPGADEAFVWIDQSELDGALLNLIINARDAQPDGGEILVSTCEVTLSDKDAATMPGARAGTFLRLSVEDQGVGMSNEVARRAQEPFFSTKGPGSGTGLGLTSVATSVARVDGFISLVSRPDDGTVVSIYLPPATDDQAKPSDDTGEMPFGDGELVLVVEDDALVREAVMQRLEAIGYAVIEAGTGDDALQVMAEGEPVDLVFTDVVMPGTLSGYDLVETITKHYPDVAVLLTSGHVSTTHGPKDTHDTTTELLAKPYTLATLANAISRALSRTRTSG